MIGSFFSMAFAVVLITKGADWFVDSSVHIAEMTNIRKAVIGATIVAIGTTFPEFMVSFTAALNNETQISLGNIIGSILCNIGLCLAIAAIIRPITIHKKLYARQSVFMIIAGLTVTIFAIFSDAISRPLSLILLVEALLYILFSIYSARGVDENNKKRTSLKINKIIKEFFLFLIGLFMVIIGARLLISSGVAIAQYFKIPKIIIALTMISIGTSLPELITAIASTIKGQNEIAIGNVIGANILDITWALGSSSFVRTLPIPRQLIFFDLPVMILLMILVFIFAGIRTRFKRREGIILLFIYCLYITFLVKQGKMV